MILYFNGLFLVTVLVIDWTGGGVGSMGREEVMESTIYVKAVRKILE